MSSTEKRKAIVIGLDGLEPNIVESMMSQGRLPNLQKIRQSGGYSRLKTTYPAQTPVAWSTFATGRNPGGHGIFDFVRRNPPHYLPVIALNRYEQKNRFSPPQAVNLRKGVPFWKTLSNSGIRSIVLRCPCTYPPDELNGKMLSGMGVPDLRGGFGTPTFYSEDRSTAQLESENLVHVSPDSQGVITSHLAGPSRPAEAGGLTCELKMIPRKSAGRVLIQAAGRWSTVEVGVGEWSDWLSVRFKAGMFRSVRGIVRFHLVSLDPVFELYASPVNFDPAHPLFPISFPSSYARELSQQIGTFYTAGMVEDHTGFNNERIDEDAFWNQCHMVMREREQMMLYELERMEEGFFFCLFDTPDRVQHMLWHHREPDHPLHQRIGGTLKEGIIETHYAECDAVVGKVLEYCDPQTLMIVLSDHGMHGFQRGVNLNTWLLENELLALKKGVRPGEDTSEFLNGVDWNKTKAYSLGLAGIYFNLQGRERHGIINQSEASCLQSQLSAELGRLADPEKDRPAIRSVKPRSQVYSGPYTEEAPDLIVNFAAGYRASWQNPLGGISQTLFDNNTKIWSGDHVIDPLLAPGVLFMNQKFQACEAGLLDLAPTILTFFDVARPAYLEGSSLISGI